MFLEVFEVQFLGGLMTFDAVTGYGLVCAAVFLTGFIFATHYEKTHKRRTAARKN